MSILIKGIEMPKSCYACMFSRTDIRNVDWCVLTEKDLPCDCPLIPVPEHGDLIDLKAPFEALYYDEMTEEWSEKTVTVEDALYGCMVSSMPPVIIPADPAEEGEG